MTDATAMPAPPAAGQFVVVDRVYLRGLRAGQAIVYWSDLDYWSRHIPDSLMPVEAQP